MTISVHSYTKHLNGKLVTVHGYSANRDQLIQTTSYSHSPVHREHVNRGEAVGMAPSGTYIQPHVMQGMGGLTAYLYKPGSPERTLPVYRWRRTILPKRGLYEIPKKESGNLDDYISD